MEFEIELKLLTNKRAGEVIETRLLPLLNANVTQETHVLTNHYFDTPERTLRHHNTGLRIRGNNQKFEQTLKTPGKSIGGLHQRPEYNVQLDESKNQNVKIPDLRLFPLSAWPENIDVDDLQARIETLFTTHFQRKAYILEFSNGDIVELVWDLGEVTSSNNSVPICEIELELKKGSTAVLFDLAKQIVELLPTTIGRDSKAARGYNLLDGLATKEFVYSHQKLPEDMQIEAEIFVSFLTMQLDYFQVLAAETTCQYSELLATNIKQVLVDLEDGLAKFKLQFPCPALDHIHLNSKVLLNDWSLAIQRNDKNAATNLLACAQTTQLQLNIVQCLVEQPWPSNI